VSGRAEEWTVEGVARCPGDCGRYFDVEATLPELENLIETHDCAKEETRYMPWQL
jgi:hypothetical protein